MSTVAEIEAALSTLSPEELRQVEDALHRLQEVRSDDELEELYKLTGFHPLPKRGGPPITNEFINGLREELGI